MGCVEDYKEAAMKAARFIIKDDPANDPNAVLADAPAGKEFKFDDSKVLIEQHLAPIFSDKNMKIQADVIDTIMDLMGPLGKKIKHLKGLDISEVSDYANAVKDPSKIVPYNIALKELLDTQKSEHDKMLKTNGIDTIEKISDDGVMNVGLARSASVIGRRYAYTLGYRFKSNPDENQRLSALSIEKLYHNLGMDILQNMQNDGLVELTKGQIINDFIKEGDVKRSYAPGDLVIKTDIARLNLDKLFSESDYKENGDLYKAVLRGNKKLRKDSDAKSLNVVNAIVNGINLAKIPSTIALPLTEKSEIHDTNDAITTSPAAEEARTLISETPVEINENVIPYIKDLASKWKKSKLTFTHFIEDYAESDLETLNSMFGINPSHLYSDEIEDSVQGQNRSKYTALEELLNNIEEFTDGNKAIELYTNYSYVRNARFNMDNTVLNGVSSKYVRYMVTSGESTVDITPENESLIKHTIDAILDQKDSLGADTMYKKRSTNGDGAIAWKSTKGLEEGSKEYIAADQHNYDLIAGFVKDPILENYLEAYRDGVKSTGREQTESYSNIISDGNFMAALDTLGAISDYRDALQSKTPMKTRFNTKSDATASGGSITTATSVGYSQKAISVMEQLGFLKGGKADLNDIYGLLEDRLNKVVSGEAKDRSGKKKKTDLEEFLKVVYRGKMRDLSKDPTMTFVYNQQETGAIQTIAETVTEKLIKSIGDSTINEETNKTYGEETGMYIAKLLKLQDPIITYEMLFSRENIKKDLITALSKKSGIITFIHKELELAVNPIIEERKSTILSLYKEANKLFKNNVKILPAIAKFSTDTGSAIESTIENIYKNKYGMPLTKLQNILHPAKGDGQVDLVTIKEMANETTSVVNTTHGQDNAIGSLATIRAVKRFKAMYPREKVPGVTWVHDEFITAPKLGKLIEEEYISAFPEVVANYSVEEELMKLVLEKDPTNKVALGLKPKIEEAISTKKALMKNFTAESGKVYGNKVGTYDLKLGKSTPPNDGGKKSSTKEAYQARDAEKKSEYAQRKIEERTQNRKIAARKNESPLWAKLRKSYPEINVDYIKNIPTAEWKGFANIQTDTVVLNEDKMTEDTLPHELAHHYIAMFRDTPIVQEAVAKWKTEEELVQAIGEQVVEQKGEVYGWWKQFTEWVKDFIGGVDSKTKEELRNLLTDAFLEKKDLGKKAYTANDPIHYQIKEEPYPDDFDPNTNYVGVKATAPEVIIGKSAHMLNQMSKNLLIDNAERLTTSFAGSMDRFLDVHFPMYADARRRVLGLYNDSAASPALQELAHYMKLANFKGKAMKNMFLSKSHNLKEERNAREHKMLGDIHELTRDFSEEGQRELYNLVTKVPIHNFFNNDADITSKKALNAKAAELEGSLGQEHLSIVDDTVSLIVDKVVKPNSIYNMADKYDPNSPIAKKVELLITLKSMQKAGLVDSIFNLQTNHTPLYQTMKDNSMALYAITNKLHDMSPKGKKISHQLVTENFGGRKQFKPITIKDRKLYEIEGLNGWKIIKEPTSSSIGVVVKDVIDDTFTEGASLSNDLPSHDIDIPKHMVEHLNQLDSNVIKVDGKYKLILSREEKLKAGLIEDMGTALVKSASNVIAVDDSMYLRNKLLENQLRSTITSNSDKEIETIVTRINDEVIDHPWVLKIEEGVKFDELPKEIQQRYKPIAQKMSKLNGFDKEVTHVRKDIRHWLIGGHAPSLFKNNKLQKMSKITKELVAGTKIGMIMLNPAKLAVDSVSNNLQLSMLGVPATKIASYSQAILKSVDSFNKIKNAMYEAKLKYKANPTEGREKRYKSLQDKLKQHDLYTAYNNGFMNSLSSDILNSNVDTTEGLQADIHKSLKYLLTDKNGEKNTLHEIIGSASRFGMDGGHILNSIGSIVSNFNSDKEVENYLRGVTENIRKIKRDDDMVNYLAQFTISPNAETVKAGTWLNDFMDMSMREVYRRHLIDTGVDPKKAIEKAIAASPDYKEDMPLGLKMLSDYFILRFPSFGFRVIQPTAYLARNKPVNVALEQYLQHTFGGLETFFDAHPMVRVLEGHMVNQPFSEIGVQSVLPTNIFNFGQ